MGETSRETSGYSGRCLHFGQATAEPRPTRGVNPFHPSVSTSIRKMQSPEWV